MVSVGIGRDRRQALLGIEQRGQEHRHGAADQEVMRRRLAVGQHAEPTRSASTGLRPRVAASSFGTSAKACTRAAARPSRTAASSPPPSA